MPMGAGNGRVERWRLLDKISRLLAVAALTTMFQPAAWGDDESVSAIAARIDQHGAETRLLFELSAPVVAQAFAVAGPRIVVDLPRVAFLLDPSIGLEQPQRGGKGQNAAAALIKAYRFGQFAPGRSRVVIELAHPAKVLRAESVMRAEGARLEIDLAPVDAAKFAEAVADHARALSDAPAPPQIPPPLAEAEAGRALVVIDPGHGGVDAGASGKHGELEKSIVFDFARTLKAKIEAEGRLRVLLTRDEDTFVALEDRVRFARERGAALFLSIHADTLSEPSVEGATIYTIAARASDVESARVAAKENKADQAAGLEGKAAAEEVGDILFELTRRETRALGREFAAFLVAKWREGGGLNKNPSRSASFVVLKAPDIPSALLELGYLSSERDLKNLLSPEWRDRAAAMSAAAIAAYFANGDHGPHAAAQ